MAVTLSKEQKQGIIGKFKIHEGDSGSPEVQIALLTEKIHYLTDHFKVTSGITPRGAACCGWWVSGAGSSTI